MADNEKVSEESSEVTEWDILSLTSSTYTAMPFRRGLDSVYVSQYGDFSTIGQDPFPGLFMSDDFVFPPSEHENLPIESEFVELSTENDSWEASCAVELDDESSVQCKGKMDDGTDGSHSVSSDLKYVDEMTSSNSESPKADANRDKDKRDDETASSDLKSLKIQANQDKDNRSCMSALPCQPWWKNYSACICRHAMGVKTVCSIVAAAALLGFVVLGQRWQQDKWHHHQWQLSISSEKMSRIMGSFSRWKDGLAGGYQLRSLVPGRAVSASLGA